MNVTIFIVLLIISLLVLFSTGIFLRKYIISNSAEPTIFYSLYMVFILVFAYASISGIAVSIFGLIFAPKLLNVNSDLPPQIVEPQQAVPAQENGDGNGNVVEVNEEGMPLNGDDGMCALDKLSGNVRCDRFGRNPGWINFSPSEVLNYQSEWDKTRAQRIMRDAYVHGQYYGRELTPRTASDIVCPSDVYGNSAGQCVKHLPNGSRIALAPLSCARSKLMPNNDRGGNYAYPVKPGYMWNGRKYVAQYDPCKDNYGKYCKSLTTSRSVTPSNPNPNKKI